MNRLKQHIHHHRRRMEQEEDRKLLTAEEMAAAIAVVKQSELRVRRTPLLEVADTTRAGGERLMMSDALPESMPKIRLLLKMECAQRTGSFKLRGIANQLHVRGGGAAVREEGAMPHFVTMSAGNYGRSFAFAAMKTGARGTVLMPESAPESRAEAIRGMGCKVERWPVHKLMDGVRKVSNGNLFLVRVFPPDCIFVDFSHELCCHTITCIINI